MLEAGESSVKLYFASHFVTQAKSRVTHETLYLDDFKCDSYILHSYYKCPYYPQNWKEAFQNKTLERFLREVSTTPTLLKRTTHPKERIR